MQLLRREAKQLRRKYLKKAAHRNFDYHSFDRWIDWEYAKSAIPLVPWIIVSYSEGQTAAATTLLIAGVPFTIFWFGFVSWNTLAVAARLQDKRYMLITRKYLEGVSIVAAMVAATSAFHPLRTVRPAGVEPCTRQAGQLLRCVYHSATVASAE